MRSNLTAGARAIAPLTPPIAVLGIVFGSLARAAGFSLAAAVVMSATTFAGSAQFAAVSIIGTGGTVFAAVAAAALLNARYGVMGLTVGPSLRGSWWRRVLLAQLVVDETWAIGYDDQGRLIGAGLLLFVVHVGSTAIGAAGGSFIADPKEFGLDAAFPALFLILARPHVTTMTARIVAAVGGAIALCLTPFVPPGLPIVFAAAASVVGLRLR